MDQIPGLGSLKLPFQGIMRLSSPASIAVVALRGRNNERSDFLITTLPAAAESSSASMSVSYFPHIASSGGYTTQFIRFSGRTGQSSSGTLTFFTPSGNNWLLTPR